MRATSRIPLLAIAPLLALAPLSLPLSAQRATAPHDSTAARIDSIFARWDHVNSPGCALGVSRGGRMVYERGYGMANLEQAIAITPQSIFHVASISKQFTATAILLLARDGKLSLDDDVRKYVPELPTYGKTITIDHLLHHTSGLRDQWDLLGLSDWREDDVITQEDVMRVVTRQRSLNFEPGEEYLYSNTGYTLLAVIAERVSGQSLQDFLHSHVFEPLGMTRTHVHDDHTMIVPGRTQAYRPRKGGGWRISIPVFDTYGATSLFTTVGDLLKWEQNFADATVGGSELIRTFTTPGRLNDGSPITYARGVVVTRYRGLETVGHSGADAGYRADVVRFPQQDLAVAALCNLANISPSVLTRRVAEVYLEGSMTPEKPSIAARAAPAGSREVARYAGVYWNPHTELIRRFEARHDTLIAVFGSGIPLQQIGDGRFAGPGAQEYEFVAQPGGTLALRIPAEGEGQRAQLFERLEPFAPGAKELAEYAGRFYSGEITTAYDLVVRGDSLIALSRRGSEHLLQPAGPDLFRGDGLGTVRFVRNDGNIAALLISTGRMRRLRFDRVRS